MKDAAREELSPRVICRITALRIHTFHQEPTMRAEIIALANAIEQSTELLRRRL